MTIESPVVYITDLDNVYPAAGDYGSEGDDHIRNIKTALAGTFTGFTGAAVTASEAELNYLDITTLGTAQASKALTISAGSTWTAAGMTCANLGTITTVDINGGTWQGTIDGNWTAASQTCADLGAVTTCDINGGTVNGLSSLSCATGASITEISTDGTMAGDSDTAVPTEKAVKTYVDSASPEVSAAITLFEAGTGAGGWGSGADSGSGDKAHGLSGTPDDVIAYVECVTAESPYAVGDRIYIRNHADYGPSVNVESWSIAADSTSIFCHHSAVTASTRAILTSDGAGGTMSLLKANWKMVAKAIKY